MIRYAFQDDQGICNIQDTAEEVRDSMLRDVMGWRYSQPNYYSKDEAWERLLKHGKVVKVRIEVVNET